MGFRFRRARPRRYDSVCRRQYRCTSSTARYRSRAAAAPRVLASVARCEAAGCRNEVASVAGLLETASCSRQPPPNNSGAVISGWVQNIGPKANWTQGQLELFSPTTHDSNAENAKTLIHHQGIFRWESSAGSFWA